MKIHKAEWKKHQVLVINPNLQIMKQPAKMNSQIQKIGGKMRTPTDLKRLLCLWTKTATKAWSSTMVKVIIAEKKVHNSKILAIISSR